MAEPILRWAGSKKKLLPILASASPPEFARYVEPFVGSAVLFLKLNAPEALLGDLNRDLIESYETIRSHPRAVWNRVSAMSQEPEHYYKLRAMDINQLKELDRAARFIYLNRFCFNGVYRTNLSGQFNVARGQGHLYVPDVDVFMAFARSLRQAELSCVDFEEQVAKTQTDDFLYLDPPYALSGKRDRGEYGIGSFRDKDEARLVDSILSASGRGVKILLSYSPSEFITKKLAGWKIHNLSVARNVAGFAGSRRRADEILVSNYDWCI
ncbi:DNA adenine methylase [Undibacterium sp. Di27W]|uniref:DNA adenine methylase n=1 Tax=Undibacterium sp. Di27W TaxID=3413036 RepID=UPI003BF43415